MTIWLIFALMTGLAVFLVLWPLSRPHRAVAKGDNDADFFRQQIAEIDHEVACGRMPVSESDSARAEAGRRLLRALDQQRGASDHGGEPTLMRRRAASAIALSAIPLITLVLYGALGQPEASDMPLGERLEKVDTSALQLDEAIARIEGHLARQPDDGRGWETLAPVYMRQGRFRDAVHAFSEIVRLNGTSAARLADLGEAHVMADAGSVSVDARIAFERALAIEHNNPKANFYMAHALEQDGDPQGALQRLKELLSVAPYDAPWRAVVKAKIKDLEGSNFANVLGSDIGKSIAALAPEDQLQAITDMVNKLAARAETGDIQIEEWVRLIRSYLVLGENAKARQAFADAQKNFAKDAVALKQLDDLAAEYQRGKSKPTGKEAMENRL